MGWERCRDAAWRRVRRRRPALLLACALGAAALLPPAVGAQQPPPAPLSPRDSTLLADSARVAQARFERLRRSLVRVGWVGGGGSCDERIGRFCLSFTGRRDDWWEPGPEDPRAADAREALIARLERTARALPGDGWVAGQRARYLAEAGRADRWHDLPCLAEGWWCAALSGFSHHLAGDFTASEEAFAAALEAMEPAARARWESLELLLDHRVRRAYRRLPEGERAAFHARLWALAEPLYLVPGNDRRTEHFARLVRDRLFDEAETLDPTGWGSDLREILLRYGDAAAWQLPPPPVAGPGGRSLVARYRPSAREFLPALPLDAAPTGLRADAWNLEDDRPRTAFAPRYARHWRQLDHQSARFPRGEGTEVVAVLAVEPDGVLPRGARLLTGLALLPGGAGPPRLVTSPLTAPARVALRADLPPGGALLGVEAHAPDYVWAARARYGLEGVAPGGGARLSDLLLLEASGEAASLEEALTSALPRTRLRPNEPFAVYWEISGMDGAAGEIAFTLTLEPEDAGWFRRALVRLGARRDPELPAIRWEQPLREGETEMARSLRVSPPPLPPGAYRLRLAATLPDGSRLESLRALELAR